MPPLRQDLFERTILNAAAWLVLGVFVTYLIISNRILLNSLSNIWFDAQRFGQLLCWSLAFITATLTHAALRLKPTAILLALVMLARAATSPLPGWAITEAAFYVGMVLASAWVCVARQSAQITFDRTALLSIVWFGLANCSIPLLIYYRVITEHIEVPLNAIFYGFSNHRFFTQVQLLTIPLLALPFMAQIRSPAFRHMAMLAALLCWALTFAAGTRAVYVALLGGAVVAWLWLGLTGRAWVTTQAKLALAGWFLFIMLFHALPWLAGINIPTDNVRLSQIDSALDSSGRVAMWNEALRLIWEHPFLGIGPMQYAAIPNRVAGGPHNIPLQFLLEWGIPLGSAMLAIPLIGLWKLGNLVQTGGELAPLRTCLFVTLLAATIDAFFEGIVSVPYSAVLLACIIGWAWGNFPEPLAEPRRTITRLTKITSWITRSVSMLLGVYLAWFALYPIERIRQHNLDYLTISKSALMPRMWAQGLINLEYDNRYPERWFKSISGKQ